MRLRALLTFAVTSLFATGAHAADPQPLLLTAERVWTGEGAAHKDWAVLIAKGRIEAVGPRDKIGIPAGRASASTCPARR